MTVKREARAKAFAAIRKHRANSPTLFNPHYAIAGRSSADPLLSSKLGNGKSKYTRGPQLKTLQWEANGRVR